MDRHPVRRPRHIGDHTGLGNDGVVVGLAMTVPVSLFAVKIENPLPVSFASVRQLFDCPKLPPVTNRAIEAMCDELRWLRESWPSKSAFPMPPATNWRAS